ncbi:MAG: DegT/DnrJ/EryC1/StrS family aminotransferase [Candidatus Omnitrophica bacterium]|nr:DegT/DnrJ/EryC1/StrS family aminotransferase [Candidatus Omnitrophota bacterium]
MSVPFIDFTEQNKAIRPEINAAWEGIIEKSSFIMGPQVKKFEQEFAAYCGTKHAIGVNSGTDALYLALCALDIAPGDEVILPTYTFIATALCVSYTGAAVKFVDIEEETYNIDPQKLEKVITKKTKAIIPVHLYGQMANMDEIMSIANKHGVAVVEDACQAHGTRYKGARSGSMGKAGCFSFYPTKGLGAWGDGGAVVTNDDKVKYMVEMLRDYGRTDRYSHKMKGFNSRLDTMQAVVLSAKLKSLDHWNDMRKKVAAVYAEELKGVDVIVPKLASHREHVYQTYAVRVKSRDKVMEALKAKGVTSLIHYPIPIHLQEAYADAGYKKNDFPVSEKVCDEILSLPMFPHMTAAQVKEVANALKESLS